MTPWREEESYGNQTSPGFPSTFFIATTRFVFRSWSAMMNSPVRALDQMKGVDPEGQEEDDDAILAGIWCSKGK